MKIQSGGDYRPDAGFILFDAWVDGWWLSPENVADIARKFNIPVVPTIGIMTMEEAVNFLKSIPDSRCSANPRKSEGIVARSYPLVLFRDGVPVVWKLKIRDYR